MRDRNFRLFGAQNQNDNNTNSQLLAGAATKTAAAKAVGNKPKKVNKAVTIVLRPRPNRKSLQLKL